MEYQGAFQKYRRYYSRLEPILAKPEVKTYSSLILFLLTVSFFVFFAIKPTVSTIVSLNKQIEDAKYTDGKLQEKINALSLAQNEYNNALPDFPVIYAALPDNPEVALAGKLLEATANANNVSLNTMTFSSVVLYNKEASEGGIVSKDLLPHPFSMSISGKYSDLSSYMNMLRKMQRLAVIETVKVNNSSAQGRETNLNLDLEGSTFFLK